jgi:hypothetical protein
MRTTLAVLTLAATLLCSMNAAAASPALSTGGPADLEKAVTARAASLGKVSPGDAPFAQLAKKITRKGALIQAGFNYVTPVSRGVGATTFIGRHFSAGAFDYALVTFPGDIEITPDTNAIIIGSFAGTKEIAGANGTKTVLPVIAARVVGVIGGVTFANEIPQYAPNSPIRIYERAAVKSAAK